MAEAATTGDAAADRARIVAFVERIENDSATALVPSRFGTGVLNADFPRSWAHNFLRVAEGTRPSADELEAEAERLHSAAGHRHRHVVVRDAALGERLSDGFRRAGWQVDRTVYMVHRRPPERAGDTSAVREISFQEARPALEAFVRGAPYGDSEETVRQLVDRTVLTARAADVRHLAVFADGRIASTCQLYTDGRTAQIEDVFTFDGFRGRGYASATVLRALELAYAGGHDLAFLEADAEDWPRHLYARLGFDEVARTVSFTRPP